MTYRALVGCAALLLALAYGSGLAQAHASLTRSNIKNGQVLHASKTPKMIRAFFAEDLDPKVSWVKVFEGTGDHGLVTEKQRSVVNFRNPKEITLALPRLGKGRYYFIWYTHSTDDNHFAAGIVHFLVK